MHIWNLTVCCIIEHICL